MMVKIYNRQEAVNLIDNYGKREEFIKGWDGRSPEDYFEQYSYLEPDIWYNVLGDLGIIDHRGIN